MSLNEFGDFLAGTSASLAFLWLVFGYLQQGDELKQSNRTLELQVEELRLQREELEKQREETARLVEQAERQAEAIRDNELHARRDTALRVAEILVGEMNSALSRFLITFGYHAPDLQDSLWSRTSAGGITAFADYLVQMKRNEEQSRPDSFMARLRRKPENQESLQNNAREFLGRFELLLTSVRDCDPDGLLLNAYSGGGFGEVRWLLEEYLEV